MRITLYILFFSLFFSCSKEEIKPVVVQDELPCGYNYTHFKAGVPEHAKSRKMYPQVFHLEDLIKIYITALNNGDRKTLESLLINEQEFKDWIFPEYNIANPNCGIPADMIYKSIKNKSIEGLDRMEQDLYGKGYQFERLEFTNKIPKETYETYNLYNRTIIHVREENELKKIGIVGSVVFLNGQYKFLSYRENNFITY